MGEQLYEQALADRIEGTAWKRAVALKPTGAQFLGHASIVQSADCFAKCWTWLQQGSRAHSAQMCACLHRHTWQPHTRACCQPLRRLGVAAEGRPGCARAGASEAGGGALQRALLLHRAEASCTHIRRVFFRSMRCCFKLRGQVVAWNVSSAFVSACLLRLAAHPAGPCRECVRALRPRRIIPTVNAGDPASSRAQVWRSFGAVPALSQRVPGTTALPFRCRFPGPPMPLVPCFFKAPSRHCCS